MATKLLQKTAHVAVGIPVSAAKSVLEKAKELRLELSKSGDRLSNDLHARFDQWVEEGETLINSLMKTGNENVDKVVELTNRTEARAKDTAASMKQSATTSAENAVSTAKNSAAKTAETARAAAKTITAPLLDVKVVSGVGPATAKKLAKAGITTVAGLLERTETQKDTATLADQTGISADVLSDWQTQADLTRIKGIGPETRTLLQAAEIGTVETLASLTTKELEQRLAQLESLGFDQVPSIDTAKEWITHAKKLKA